MRPEALEDEQLGVLRHFGARLAEFGAPLDASSAVIPDFEDRCVVHKRGYALTPQSPSTPEIVVEGWGCLMRPDARLRRQIISFIMPGDSIGSFHRRPLDDLGSRIALTRTTVISARYVLASDEAEEFPPSGAWAAARRIEDHDRRLLINQIIRLGAHDAYAGLAHLFLEFNARLEAVGLSEGGVFRLPIGQRILAQALGISVVHTNNTLRRMVGDGLFRMDGGTMHLLRQDAMNTLCGFEPSDLRGSGPSSAEGLEHEPDVRDDDPYPQ